MNHVLLLAALLGCSTPQHAAAPPPQPPPATTTTTAARSTQEILAVIDRYLSDPLATSKNDLAEITKFVADSHDVSVVADEHVMPWFDEKGLDPNVAALLLVGYMAADAASQLRSGKKGDDLYAGTAGALKIYRVVKPKQQSATSAALDKLLELEASGKLKAHLDEIAATRK